MEAYRVLLVDDEEELRAGIRRKIDWDSLGFSLCGEAREWSGRSGIGSSI